MYLNKRAPPQLGADTFSNLRLASNEEDSLDTQEGNGPLVKGRVAPTSQCKPVYNTAEHSSLSEYLLWSSRLEPSSLYSSLIHTYLQSAGPSLMGKIKR